MKQKKKKKNTPHGLLTELIFFNLTTKIGLWNDVDFKHIL